MQLSCSAIFHQAADFRRLERIRLLHRHSRNPAQITIVGIIVWSQNRKKHLGCPANFADLQEMSGATVIHCIEVGYPKRVAHRVNHST